MGEHDDGRAALRAEIEAFRQGFGQPGLLVAALREALVLVPVTADDRILTSTVHGIDWICAFTDEAEFVAYLHTRGEVPSAPYRALFGRPILDEILPALAHPTGVVIDAAGAMPMAFPPEVEQVAS